MYMMFEIICKVSLLHKSFIRFNFVIYSRHRTPDKTVKGLRNNVGTYIAQRFFAVTTLTGLIRTTLAHYNVCTV